MARKPKINEVKVDLASYRHYWRGVKKVGKTTLFRDFIDELYNGDLSNGLLISIGNEDGYKALDGLYYDVAPNWQELDEIINDLCENKEDNNYKFICFDTVDELIAIGQREIIRQHTREKGVKPSGFNACFGGYTEPRRKLAALIDNMMTRLDRSGYGTVYIGHTKYKEIEEKDGTKYQMLTSNLNSDYDMIFSAKADINMIINVEKETDHNRLVGTHRYMCFRNDCFVDAGGRFSEIPEKVDFSARNYIDAVTEGIKASIKRGPKDDKALEEKRQKEIAEKEAYYQEHKDELSTPVAFEDALEAEMDAHDPSNLIAEIDSIIKKMPMGVKKETQEKLKEKDLPLNYKKVTDMGELKKILAIVKELDS